MVVEWSASRRSVEGGDAEVSEMQWNASGKRAEAAAAAVAAAAESAAAVVDEYEEEVKEEEASRCSFLTIACSKVVEESFGEELLKGERREIPRPATDKTRDGGKAITCHSPPLSFCLTPRHTWNYRELRHDEGKEPAMDGCESSSRAKH